MAEVNVRWGGVGRQSSVFSHFDASAGLHGIPVPGRQVPSDSRRKGGGLARVLRQVLLLALMLAFPTGVCKAAEAKSVETRQFVALTNFSSFVRETVAGNRVFTSPWVKFERPWNELVVSWNAACPSGSGLKVEVRARGDAGTTPFLTYAWWAEQTNRYCRQSVPGQSNALAEVKTDILVCHHPMREAQVRLTLQPGDTEAQPALKFLGLSGLNSRQAPASRPPNRVVWGKSLEVPERSQVGHAGASGWCSPTSVAMVLAYWGRQLQRSELNPSVPEVARGVYDPCLPGTGNWPFNVAYAGHFEGLRAYATRLEGMRELEDWVAAGVPVVASVSFDFLTGHALDEGTGHLIVVVGFTSDGQVVINDPWPNPRKGSKHRQVFSRQSVEKAWNRSHRTVYLIYPEGWSVPR